MNTDQRLDRIIKLLERLCDAAAPRPKAKPWTKAQRAQNNRHTVEVARAAREARQRGWILDGDDALPPSGGTVPTDFWKRRGQ
jgi:hypothetical protein